MPYPPLVVVDLDCTLWVGFCESVVGPFLRLSQTQVACKLRRTGEDCVFSLHSETFSVLTRLRYAGVRLAIASRVSLEPVALALLSTLGLLDYFTFKAIYPLSKTHHLRAISAATGVPLPKILFFDDDKGNVKATAAIGVCSLLVDRSTGLSLAALERGLQHFSATQRSQGNFASYFKPLPVPQPLTAQTDERPAEEEPGRLLVAGGDSGGSGTGGRGGSGSGGSSCITSSRSSSRSSSVAGAKRRRQEAGGKGAAGREAAGSILAFFDKKRRK